MIKQVKIKKIIEENYKVKSFVLDTKLNANPGQFVMISIPDTDEKPFTLSSLDPITITVEEKGIFTKELFKLKEGDKVGIRGPYGNGFTLKKNSCIVAGGLGIAPVRPMLEKVDHVIYGAKTEEELIIKENKYNICTDDGSYCEKGFTTEILKKLIKKENIKTVYTCGPEIMIKKVFDICEENNIECQASLERYMRCGFGVCGACTCGDQLVCKDGPVFNSEKLRYMKDFGNKAMLKSGKEVPLKDYYEYRER